MHTQREILPQMIEDADYRPPERSLNFRISMVKYRGVERIERALRAAGIEAVATPSTQERDGTILTDRLASFTWDSQTGGDDCRLVLE